MMKNIMKISEKLKIDFINWEGIFTLTMHGWKLIPIKISDELLKSNLKDRDINYIVNTIKSEIKNNKYKQWSILSNNILAVK